jgi:V/A-type H+-transporting ATPase subunit A
VSGRIIGISGPTVSVDLQGLKLYERVVVGRAGLMGEVVRLEQQRAVVQVYESTRGLGVGEPVVGTGTQLTVRLGPGLLDQMFDGLQRPLQAMREAHGPFIRPGESVDPTGATRSMRFIPAKKKGDPVGPGESIGHVEEGAFRRSHSNHDADPQHGEEAGNCHGDSAGSVRIS